MPPSAPSRAPETWTDISFNAFPLEMLLMSLFEVNWNIRKTRMYFFLPLNVFLVSAFIVVADSGSTLIYFISCVYLV